jgi:hypothetical protein
LQIPRLSLVSDWDIPPGVTSALVAVAFIYVRGWLALRRTRPETLPVWRLLSDEKTGLERARAMAQ